jgi:hypothetical protein
MEFLESKVYRTWTSDAHGKEKKGVSALEEREHKFAFVLFGPSADWMVLIHTR